MIQAAIIKSSHDLTITRVSEDTGPDSFIVKGKLGSAYVERGDDGLWHITPLPDQDETIQADDKDSLFALFFRKYDNAYKYCNSVSYALACPSMRQGYLVWLSDINNYADNGGDMT